MKNQTLFLLMAVINLANCTQSTDNNESQEVKTEQTAHLSDTMTMASSTSSDEQIIDTAKSLSIEPDIHFIREKYAILVQDTNYTEVPFEIQCDERSSTKLVRRYNKNGQLSYLKYEECGEHGCSIRHHYYWNGELIFIFHKSDFTPGSSHIVEEHRTYFKNGEMIRCLEKEARYYEGQASMDELLRQAENRVVDCTSEKRTANLSAIESLSLEAAEKYFCSASDQ